MRIPVTASSPMIVSVVAARNGGSSRGRRPSARDVGVGVQVRDRPGFGDGTAGRWDLMGRVEGLEVAGEPADHREPLRLAARAVPAAHSTAAATVTVSIPLASRWPTKRASWRPSSSSW